MDASFLLNLIEAMANDQSSLSLQTLTDEQTTELDTQMEAQMCAYQIGPHGSIANAEAEINKYVGQLQTATNATQRGNISAKITYWQSVFQNAQTTYTTNQNQAGTAVQDAQTQTGQDSSNLQQKAQLAQAVTTISSYCGNLLAAHY
jgi:hypothetical protein